MNPYFFGPSDQPLFGAFHPAQATSNRAVLLCYPIAQEYMRSHWAMRQLARRLTESGLHVLRFDYSGTGDSAGEASVRRWRQDLALAARELRDVSGAQKLSLVGVRFGATLAAKAAADVDAGRVILWDPIESGRAYLSRLEAMHRVIVADTQRFPIPRLSGRDELVGFAFPPDLSSEIAAIDLCRQLPEVGQLAGQLAIVASAGGSGRTLADALSRAGRPCDYHQVGDVCNWHSVDTIEDQLLAPAVVQAIARIASQ